MNKKTLLGILLTLIILASAFPVVSMLRVDWSIPMIVSLAMLFSLEFIAQESRGGLLWTVINTNRRDKLTFFISLTIFWIFVCYPQYLGIKSPIINLLVIVCGLLLVYLLARLFMSTEAKRKLGLSS